MAKLTLVQMVTQAAAEIGQTPPTSIIGNTDSTAIQMLALAQREGRECAKKTGAWGGWPQLRQEYTFSTAIGIDAYSFPTNYQYLIPQTGWDRTFRWQLLGPLEAQEWQVLKSGITVAGPRSRWRIMGAQVFIDPVPTAIDALVFEYYANTWCTSALGVAQSAWAADSDTYALDDDLMVLGLKWRFLRAKGLDYGEEKNAYDAAVDTELSRAGSSRSLPLNATGLDGLRLINQNQIPDTGFGT